MALLYWGSQQRLATELPLKARAAAQLNHQLGYREARQQLQQQLAGELEAFLTTRLPQCSHEVALRAADYLLTELSVEQPEFSQSREAVELLERLRLELGAASSWQLLEQQLRQWREEPLTAFQWVRFWCRGVVEQHQLSTLEEVVDEVAADLVCAHQLRLRPHSFDLSYRIEGLLGSHETLTEGRLEGRLDRFLLRFSRHQQVILPAWSGYQTLRQQVIEQQKRRLRLAQYQSKPLASFVRNRLINEAYLPIIGDNLAKQMGTVGEGRRSDLMGLLMVISPPGYGKTTLMEYVANRLGLIFMKINCPSIGHQIDALDPAQAPNATAAQELEKLNLALEMGNNTMLYLDDIQHTNPEFLQKFISLCDATRRIEGVWRGETKSYDLRGKKFCVVMAGNPYTESGELFKIPDMLANRADIYNLGDVLSGMDEIFALSYIENCLTSNAVLAPLANREMADFYRFIALIRAKRSPIVTLATPIAVLRLGRSSRL